MNPVEKTGKYTIGHVVLTASNQYAKTCIGRKLENKDFLRKGVPFGWYNIKRLYKREVDRMKKGLPKKTTLTSQCIELDKFTTMNASYAKLFFVRRLFLSCCHSCFQRQILTSILRKDMYLNGIILTIFCKR